MKIIKTDYGIIIIEKKFEDEKMLTCDDVLCNLGEFSCNCDECPFADDVILSTEGLNIVEVEI